MTPATKEEKLAFLEDTAGFYKLSNRSFNTSGVCCYYQVNQPGCAIGRHIDKSLAKRLDKKSNARVEYVFDLLPEKLKRYGVRFLAEIQDFHDNTSYWDAKGR